MHKKNIAGTYSIACPLFFSQLNLHIELDVSLDSNTRTKYLPLNNTIL